MFDAADVVHYPPQFFAGYTPQPTTPGSGFGIGTAAPQNGLSVATGIDVDQNNADPGTGFQSYKGPAWGISFGTNSGEAIGSARVPGSPNAYGLDFYTNFTKKMSLTNGGYLGINTPSPTSQLEVNGDIQVDGTLKFADGSSLSSSLNPRVSSLTVGGSGPGLIAAGANLDPRGFSLSPLANSSKLLQGWNLTAGHGEQDLISNRGPGGLGGFGFYDYDNSGKLTSLIDLFVNGASTLNVGTQNPNGGRLEVNGNVVITAGTGGSLTFPDNTVQSTAWNGVLSGGDYAESVNVSGSREGYEPGDVLVIDPASEGKFLKSSAPYSTAVTGIYSTKPGLVGRRQLTARANMKIEVPMAMIGIVPTKVSAENGPIKPGDLLVTSSKVGYAMRGTDHNQMLGAVIGKAIGHLDSGTGVIEAVVTLQ